MARAFLVWFKMNKLTGDQITHPQFHIQNDNPKSVVKFPIVSSAQKMRYS